MFLNANHILKVPGHYINFKMHYGTAHTAVKGQFLYQIVTLLVFTFRALFTQTWIRYFLTLKSINVISETGAQAIGMRLPLRKTTESKTQP